MCLPENFIGILGECDDQTPVSELYINHLQGISISRAANATDEHNLKGIAFLRENERLAYNLVLQDFKAGIARDFTLNSIIDVIDRKISYSTGSYLELEAGKRYIKITDQLSDQLTKLKINKISLYAENALNGFTFDIIDGAITHNYTVNLVAGQNEIKLQQKIDSGAAYVAYNANQVKLWEPENYGAYSRCSDSHCICDCSFSRFIKVEYLTGTSLIDLVPSQNRNGISVSATLYCDLDSVFCNYLDAFKFAIWIKMGILTVEKYLSSDRFNPVVFAAKQDAQRLLTQWKGGVDSDGFEVKSEYWKNYISGYNQVKSHLKMSGSICFECDSLKKVDNIP